MHLLTLKELNKEEMNYMIDEAIKIKANKEEYHDILKNKSLAMLFQKTSTRTRISFEAAMTQLGGHAKYIDWMTTQLDRASLADEIICISRYVDLIMARVHRHEDIEIMAKYSEVPVINGLSDLYHPCQILGDLMTIKEKKGRLEGLKLSYVGDGNNVCNTLIIGCKRMNIKVSVATPKGYEPKEEPTLLINYPKEAVKEADVVYTDTWISMGQEKELEKRNEIFPPYQVNKELMSYAKDDAIFMHCLPAHRGYEVSDEVLDSEQSVVFDQAENRMHVQKAIILKLLGKI